MLRVLAEGPFNPELVQAQCRLLAEAAVELPQDRRDIGLIEHRESLLMPPQGRDQLSGFVEAAVRRGFCARVAVLVIPPEV